MAADGAAVLEAVRNDKDLELWLVQLPEDRMLKWNRQAQPLELALTPHETSGAVGSGLVGELCAAGHKGGAGGAPSLAVFSEPAPDASLWAVLPGLGGKDCVSRQVTRVVTVSFALASDWSRNAAPPEPAAERPGVPQEHPATPALPSAASKQKVKHKKLKDRQGSNGVVAAGRDKQSPMEKKNQHKGREEKRTHGVTRETGGPEQQRVPPNDRAAAGSPKGKGHEERQASLPEQPVKKKTMAMNASRQADAGLTKKRKKEPTEVQTKTSSQTLRNFN